MTQLDNNPSFQAMMQAMRAYWKLHDSVFQITYDATMRSRSLQLSGSDAAAHSKMLAEVFHHPCACPSSVLSLCSTPDKLFPGPLNLESLKGHYDWIGLDGCWAGAP